MPMFSVPSSLKRQLLNLLTVVAALAASLALLNSWFQAPPQTQLDLFQTNLALQAARTLDVPDYQPFAQALLGSDVVSLASKRYEKATASLEERLTQMQQLISPASGSAPTPIPEVAASELKPLSGAPDPAPSRLNFLGKELDALHLRTGILKAYLGDLEAAEMNWQNMQTPDLAETASVVRGLWGTPRRILPEAERQLRENLSGWFEGITLQRLFSLQQRSDALTMLNQEQEQLAISALMRLSLVSGIPLLGLGLGLLILIGWQVQQVWSKRAFLGAAWEVPWEGADVQAVLTGWFLSFLILGQWVPKLYLILLKIPSGQLSYWQQAGELFLTYTSGALAGLAIIYAVVRVYRPLPSDLFCFRLFDHWPLWGIGGYLAAMPLVLLASAISELFLSQGGGGNPLLPVILQSQGWGPRLLFLLVVSVCAPVFEELLFRGFLFSSLTRYLSKGSALVVSALLFAVAHLNLSDLLPLTMLGLILGVIYSHSRNLLAPMLLHSLWNAGSLVALLILGNSR
ncbi:MAG: CPBP family intramembrane metalloprotease [Synechococcaceae cyanobacterium SM2_3_1]|nr:CPBP family intramembrane metalloprotease [Synechococcaceae cyanobacterium SM2_3_1]